MPKSKHKAPIPTSVEFGKLLHTAILSAAFSECNCDTCIILRKIGKLMIEEEVKRVAQG